MTTNPQPIIDAHHHFWSYDPVEYGWIDDAMAVIRRDFLPADLRAQIEAVCVDGVISVQARQSLAETAWLMEFAMANDFIRGVVGWVPLVSPSVADDLATVAGPKLKAVRHVLQGEPDERYMLREDFNRGIDCVGRLGLTYDILIFERHLPQTIEFVDRHEDMVFVLDHIAKPRIREGVLEPWRANIRELARRPNVYCKLSGLVTEADYRAWTPEQLKPYMQTVLDAFGPNRLMFGSDWPVCLVATQYARWLEIVKEFIAPLSPEDQHQVLGGTTIEAYRL